MARLKRTLFFLGILAIVLVVIGIGYFLRYRSQEINVNVASRKPPLLSGENPPIRGGGQGTGAGSAISSAGTGIIPGSEDQGGLVSERQMLDYYVNSDGSISLIQPDGQVFRISSTENILLSSIPIANISNAAFSGDGKKILVGFGDEQLSVFDLEKQNWTPLQIAASSFPQWSPRGSRLAYISQVGEKKGLFVAEGDSLRPKQVFGLYAEDLGVKWLDEIRIILKGKESAFAAAPYFVFNTRTSSFYQLVKDAKGLDVLWSPIKDAGLAFNSGSGGGRIMELIDKSANIAKTISFTTLPSVKCAYESVEAIVSTSSLFSAICAVPRSVGLFAQATLPDDYFKGTLFTNDNFLRVDLKTGESQSLYLPSGGPIDATRLKIVNSALYFVNRYDQKLYMIPLTRS